MKSECPDGCFNKPKRWIATPSAHKDKDRIICRKCGKWIGYAKKGEHDYPTS